MTPTKLILAALVTLALGACATENTTTAPAAAATREAPKAACAPPPRELVKKDLDAGSGDFDDWSSTPEFQNPLPCDDGLTSAGVPGLSLG